MLLNRIRCHFCGSRSPYSKSSGIAQYQCASCEAVNYLDSKGNIIDTPASIAARPEQSRTAPLHTFTRPLPETLDHQDSQPFCNTCLHNQRVYVEVLSNYLPDDDDPKYQEYEDALPRFKEDLAQKYPQVCIKCAPKAQMQINRADYYASTERIAHTLKETKRTGMASGRGKRDDWYKWSTRLLLSTAGLVAYGCIFAQTLWHIYGMLTLMTGTPVDEANILNTVFEPTPRECLRETLRMRLGSSCYTCFSASISHALLISVCLLWYNPGLKYWYHHTFRVDTVTGQTEYFRMQIITLLIRSIAWFNLSNAKTTSDMTTAQVAAAHGFMVMFLVITQWVSNRQVGYVKFSANTRITPKPSEVDVLGAFAGPADERSTGRPSSIPPSQLFARDRIAPFPIANLAPKQFVRSSAPPAHIPSPPYSQEDDEDTDIDGDSMNMDWQPSLDVDQPATGASHTPRSPNLRSRGHVSGFNHNSTRGAGWTGMRSELFGIDDGLAAGQERKRAEEMQNAKLSYQPPAQLNPFRGRLPQAPMSMERKLRNPVSQVQPFKMAPLSKQQDFMKQMRNGIQQGKTFTREPESKISPQIPSLGGAGDDETDEEFSPAKNRTRGNLDLRQSGWRLASDVAQATGLEDLFGGNSFRIDDEPAIVSAASAAKNRRNNDIMIKASAIGIPLAVAAIAWNIQPVRRAICLWLVARLESLGI